MLEKDKYYVFSSYSIVYLLKCYKYKVYKGKKHDEKKG